nr:pentatricopeptide repeat-containing protein At1g11290, chloroplastic-like [Tanacetum cinerariifolium]
MKSKYQLRKIIQLQNLKETLRKSKLIIVEAAISEFSRHPVKGIEFLKSYSLVENTPVHQIEATHQLDHYAHQHVHSRGLLGKLMPTKTVEDYEDQELVFYNDQKEPLLGLSKEFKEIKSKMEEIGIRKIPGYSSVDLENEVHTFYSGSSWHYPYKEIYDFLETLIDNIKAVGYVPANDLIHEAEDDLQE